MGGVRAGEKDRVGQSRDLTTSGVRGEEGWGTNVPVQLQRELFRWANGGWCWPVPWSHTDNTQEDTRREFKNVKEKPKTALQNNATILFRIGRVGKNSRVCR